MEGLENIIDNSLGLAAGFILGACIIALAIVIFMIVCQFKLHKKMGAPGWSALVPFYNSWVLYENVWNSALMSLVVIIPNIITIFESEGTLYDICSLIVLVMGIITNWKMYKRFGKSTGFCVAGIFFTPITHAICAFGSAEFANEIEE